MDFRAAIVVHLCLLVAQASCRVIREDGKKALIETALLLRTKNVQPVLKYLSIFEPFSNHSCQLLNGTELGEPDEQRVTRAHLSSFSCYTLELSNVTQQSKLNTELKVLSQGLDSMAELIPGSAHTNCSLPDLKEHLNLFHYVGCLLQRLDHRLRNATF